MASTSRRLFILTLLSLPVAARSEAARDKTPIAKIVHEINSPAKDYGKALKALNAELTGVVTADGLPSMQARTLARKLSEYHQDWRDWFAKLADL